MKRKRYRKSFSDKVSEFFNCIGLGVIGGVLLTGAFILLYVIIQNV